MELTTIAKPYANAVFEIAQQNKSFIDWRSILEVGATIANDATIHTFISSPNPAKANKIGAIFAIFSSALDRELSKQEKTFVDLLLKNNRINALPSILKLFNAMSNLSSNTKSFHVISAYKLSEKEKEEIIKNLSDKYKAMVSIDTEIDKNLICGVVIKEGDKVIDLSTKACLHKLNLQLSSTY